jgi:DNA-binding response OmpR family regulator
MDDETANVLRTIRAQREAFAAQLAALEEITNEQRAEILSSGVDPYLLRDFELDVVDMALNSILRRNADGRLKNVEEAASDSDD